MYPEFNPIEQMKRSIEQGHGGAFSLNDDPEEDKALSVKFILEPRKNDAKSKAAGRLVCDEVEICEIRIPGAPDTIRNEVTDRERQRFPRSYAAFRNGIEQGRKEQDSVSGTPLREWPLITTYPGLIEEANYKGIRTVEHLAQMSDGVVKTMGIGWVDLRNKARDWLKKAEGGAVEARLRSENDDLRARMATLEKMLETQAVNLHAAQPTATSAGPDPLVARLAAQVEALTNAIAAKPSDPAPKKRGPKPKNQTPEV